MEQATVFRGGTTNTTGACPGCGRDVRRRHVWNNAHASDVYDCPGCGAFAYGAGARPEPAFAPSEATWVHGVEA